MRKIIVVLAFVLVMISSSITAFAGDIPESLLIDESAQLFFGEVLSYHPNKETPSISVSPVVGIKGNIKEGTKQNYINPYAMGERTACDFCPYKAICGFDEKIAGYEYRKLGKSEKKEEILEKMRKEAESWE